MKNKKIINCQLLPGVNVLFSFTGDMNKQWSCNNHLQFDSLACMNK